MRIRDLMLALLFTSATAGCTGRAYIADDAPPPAREEIVVYKPGYIWIQGQYVRANGGWAWTPGRYVRERPGYVWIGGRWDRWPQGYVWVHGRWKKQGRVVSSQQD